MVKLLLFTAVWFIYLPASSQSYTLYFVNGDSIGVNPSYDGALDNPLHWDTISGGPGNVSVLIDATWENLIPKKGRNCIMDSNSGLNGQTITINGLQLAFEDLIIHDTVHAVFYRPGKRMDIYGDFKMSKTCHRQRSTSVIAI